MGVLASRSLRFEALFQKQTLVIGRIVAGQIPGSRALR
jgi:hypothetical protein